MSEIDSYRHTCLGTVTCPAEYPIMHGNERQRNIPLYRLDEDALDGHSWQAKQGDILLGGGSGESAALRISMPAMLRFLTDPTWDDGTTQDQLLRAYWTPTQAYIFGDGYHRLGWTPDEPLEWWLAEHIIAFIVREYPQEMAAFRGPCALEKDGAICRREIPPY